MCKCKGPIPTRICICTEDRELQCGETRLVNLSRKRKKYKEFAKVKLFSYNMSSNESVLSTIISFQIYIQKNAILEKKFEEIFAALPLAQISSNFFH